MMMMFITSHHQMIQLSLVVKEFVAQFGEEEPTTKPATL